MTARTSNRFDNLEDDEYVAAILKSEAKARSERYNLIGLQAFLPKRPTGAPPKPNTRFLRSIVREADSHNAALSAKEADEAKERLKHLKESDRRRKRKEVLGLRNEDQGGGDQEVKGRSSVRRHQVGDLDSSSTSPKHRRRYCAHGEDNRTQRARGRHDLRHTEDDSARRRPPSRSPDSSHRPKSLRSRSYSRDHGTKKRRKDRSASRHRRRRRDDSSERHRDKSSRRRSNQKQSDSEPEKTKSRRSQRDTKSGRSNRRNLPPLSGQSDKSRLVVQPSKIISDPEKSDSSSDPLDEIIGPAPPPQIPSAPRFKGRGSITTSFGTSAMDARFNNINYDPSLDIQEPEDEKHRAALGIGDEDWDQALEAYRDRQKWKAQGAERLRSAGFTEEFIKQWENNNTKNEENIKWSEKGKVREWDRGKTIEEATGEVVLKAPW